MQSLETYDKIIHWTHCRHSFKYCRRLFDDYQSSRLKPKENRLIIHSVKQISSLRKKVFLIICGNSLFIGIAEIPVDRTNYHLYIPRHCYSILTVRDCFDESCVLFVVSLQVRYTRQKDYWITHHLDTKEYFLVRLIPWSGSPVTNPAQQASQSPWPTAFIIYQQTSHSQHFVSAFAPHRHRYD